MARHHASCQRQPANFAICSAMTILKCTMGTYPDPRRSSTSATAASACICVRDHVSGDLVEHLLRYVAIHHISWTPIYGVCRTGIWRKGEGREVRVCIRDYTYKRNSRLLSRVNVIRVCQLSVSNTGSMFLASSSKLGDDTVCIMRLMSSFTKIRGSFNI